MSLIGKSFKKLRLLLQHGALDAELSEEVRFHLETKTRDYMVAGMAPRAAREAALRDFGCVEQMKEECRDMRGTQWIENLWQDLRYGIRMLAKDRKFTALAVVALALGIGSATVIFSAIHGVILNTFGYDKPSQIVSFAIHDSSRSGEDGREGMSLPEFLDYRDRNNVFQDMTGGFGGFGAAPVLYSTGQGTTEFSAWYTTANLFQFMGTPALVGRIATPDDTKPGAPPVFVMTYKLWHDQFNSDPAVVGKSFTLNGVLRTLVGVMPPRFRWGWPDIWIPFPMDRNQISSDPNLKEAGVWPVGRLKPGITPEVAAADLNVVAHQLAKVYPDQYPKQFRVTAHTLADRVLTPFKTLIYPLAGAVGLLVLIACSNVANLLLARATARDREIAVRASLGASRVRLISQLLTEGLVLAIVACLAGCLLAWVGIRKVVPLVPYNTFPQEAVIDMNPVVLLFGLGVTLLTTVLSGLAPAIHSMRGELQSRLTRTGKGAGGGFRHGKLRSFLVVTEIALSMVLLTGAGLMMRTFYALDRLALGFSPQRLVSAELNLPKGVYDTALEKNNLFRQLFERLNALPGVVSTSVSLVAPPYAGVGSDLTIPGKVHSDTWNTAIELCSEGYFKTLGLSILRGRLLSESDVASGRHVAVINQVFANKYFPNDNPIGQRIKFNILDQVPDPGLKDIYFEIVGVVPDVLNRGLQRPAGPEAYIPHTITGFGDRSILVRTAVPPAALLPTIRNQVWAVDPNIALTNAGSVEDSLRKSDYAEPEFLLVLFAAFAAIGLLLVVIGIFSVMAYTVSLQTHEIGVRMALGAQPDNILSMVLKKGAALIAVGLVVGVGMSLVLTRLIKSRLWGVSANDPWTFTGVAAVVIAAGLVACLVPARRATRVDPLVALRYE
ncbi:MAG TPA: ABC transporter permease [Candidatus Acidoferrum sp.]|nr:ABC transporter permease [Candidatus Acidoferrum sp.]